jgi:hypothetical protein
MAAAGTCDMTITKGKLSVVLKYGAATDIKKKMHLGHSAAALNTSVTYNLITVLPWVTWLLGQALPSVSYAVSVTCISNSCLFEFSSVLSSSDSSVPLP